MGFGYRAKFIVNTVKALQEKAEQANGDQSGMTPEEWLIKLRSGERDEVQQTLMEFAGVGRKVVGVLAYQSVATHQNRTGC